MCFSEGHVETTCIRWIRQPLGEAVLFRTWRCVANDGRRRHVDTAMVHDTADTDSETEAVQEAATVPEGAGFGAENDVPPMSVARDTSVVSNASSGGGQVCFCLSRCPACFPETACHIHFKQSWFDRPCKAGAECQTGCDKPLHHCQLPIEPTKHDAYYYMTWHRRQPQTTMRALCRAQRSLPLPAVALRSKPPAKCR